MTHADTILNQSWEMLRAGADDRHHPMHLGVLATIHQGQPDARTVVLRQADADEGILHFHTDVRAPKSEAIRACPSVALVFYHPEERVQLRIRAEATIHHQDDAAREAWDRSQVMSRACYLVPDAPSSELPNDGIPDPVPYPPSLSEAESEAGFVNFAVVRCIVREIDWLHLHHGEHQRALFRNQDGQWQMRRLQA